MPDDAQKPGLAGRKYELFGVGLDASNAAGILALTALAVLIAVNRGFGGLTVVTK